MSWNPRNRNQNRNQGNKRFINPPARQRAPISRAVKPVARKIRKPKDEISKTAIALKGFVFGLGGAAVKGLRGGFAFALGTIIGPVLTGLGFKKKNILKMINSPLESWGKQIKSQWAKIPKPEGSQAKAIGLGIVKGIFLGIPLSVISGTLALLENGLSGIWTGTVGGIQLAIQAANLSKKLGEKIDNSAIFSGIARTNVFGEMALMVAKIAKWWDPKYGEKFEEMRNQYPNAIDYVRGKVGGLLEDNDAAKQRASASANVNARTRTQASKTPSQISSQLQDRAAGIHAQVDSMKSNPALNKAQRRMMGNRSDATDARSFLPQQHLASDNHHASRNNQKISKPRKPIRSPHHSSDH